MLLLSAVATLALAASDRQLVVATGRDEPVSTNAAAGPHAPDPIQSTGIRGRIQTQDGLPVSDALIAVECVSEPCRPIPDLGVMSNADGFFFWPLSAGRYRLTARKDSFVSDSQVIIVEPSKITQVAVCLCPNTGQ
jgi:hypothetical protein